MRRQNGGMDEHDLQQFIEAWREAFDEEIAPADAAARLDELLLFFERLAELEAERDIDESA